MSKKLNKIDILLLKSLAEKPLYGLKIEEEFNKLYNSDLTISSLYPNLDWLEKNGFISSWWVESELEWGGKRRLCYALTEKGKQESEKVAMPSEVPLASVSLNPRQLLRIPLANQGCHPSASVTYSLLECPKSRPTIEW
jgi:DNA-binding PadR family transcriptional regulator